MKKEHGESDQGSARRETLLLATLRGCKEARTPFWFMRQAGRYLPEYRALRTQQPDFLKFCYTPELTIEAALQPLRRFHPDAAIVFSDILVIPDALGRSVRFVEGEGPVLEPPADPLAAPQLDLDALDERLEPVYRSVSGLKSRLPEDVALIGFAGAPWTIAHYLVEGRGGGDGARARRLAYAEPARMARLLETLVAATAHHLRRQVEAGADALQVFDSWAGGLGENLFRAMVIDPTARLVERLRQDCPGVPIVGFPRGAGALYPAYATMTGVDAISLDAAVPSAWIARATPQSVATQGLLDNLLLAEGGPALPRAVDDILEAFAGRPHIFNLGHGVLPDTPPEHVALVSERVRVWRRN